MTITRRVLLVLVLVVLVLSPALSACSFSEGDETPGSQVTAPANASRLDSVSAEGVITPVKALDLSFEGSGRVDKILVSEGDQVVAGQLLAVLETRDLEQAVARAEARLESAQAQLAKARAGARPEEIAEARAGLAIAQAASSAASSMAAVSSCFFSSS